MEKSLLLIEKCPLKVFFVLHFQLMVSVIGLAQGIAMNATSESPNPFVGQNLNFTNPLLLTSHHVEGLIDCDKVGHVNSLQGWYSNHRTKRVTIMFPAKVSPEAIIKNCCGSCEFIDNKFY